MNVICVCYDGSEVSDETVNSIVAIVTPFAKNKSKVLVNRYDNNDIAGVISAVSFLPQPDSTAIDDTAKINASIFFFLIYSFLIFNFYNPYVMYMDFTKNHIKKRSRKTSLFASGS